MVSLLTELHRMCQNFELHVLCIYIRDSIYL